MPLGVGREYLCWNHRPPQSCWHPAPRTTWHCRGDGCSEQILGQKKEEPGPGFPQPRQRQEGQGTQSGFLSPRRQNPSPLRPRNATQTLGTRERSSGPGPQPVSAVPHFSMETKQPAASMCLHPAARVWPGPHPKGSSGILVGSQVLPRVPARAAPPMGRTLTPQRTGCVGKAR